MTDFENSGCPLSRLQDRCDVEEALSLSLCLMFMALSGLHYRAGLYIRVCAAGNLGRIWSTCGQHAIQYIEGGKKKTPLTDRAYN
jgi:hypothetical protein